MGTETESCHHSVYQRLPSFSFSCLLYLYEYQTHATNIPRYLLREWKDQLRNRINRMEKKEKKKKLSLKGFVPSSNYRVSEMGVVALAEAG